jgi:hypothetical protein
MPSLIALGGESEAVSYAANYLTGWRAAPGSVSWVRKTLKIAPPEAPVRGPSWSSLKHRASALPQNEGEVWQVDLLPTRFGSGGKKGAQTLWTLVVASATEGVVVGFEPCGEDSKPPPREILARVVEAMLKPQDEEPRRPETIQVRSKTLCKSWTPKLDEISVGCELVESLDFVESLAERVQEMKRAAEFSDEELADRADELADLLQHADEVWQADVRKLGTWITEEGEPRRPWGALVSDSASGAVLAQKLTMDGPSCELIRQALMAAMLAPALGEPHLPGMIQVASEPFRDELLPFLESLEIDCETCETLEQLDYIYGELDRSFGGGEQMAALSDTPGVTAKHVGGLFAAAAEFYRQTPWRDVPGDVPVHIHCDKFSTNNWYAVVMGQSGMTLGLAMYEDLDALKAILREDADADRRNSGLSLMFSEPFEIAIRDLDAAERHGWPVAGPEAYPLVLRVNPGLSVRPPLAWEIELLEASLRAIPPFIKRTERTPSRVTVPIATGELTLELSWVE